MHGQLGEAIEMIPVKFSTKAKTLTSLRRLLKTARIAPICTFTVAEWNLNSAKCIEDLEEVLASKTFIVRSSCKQEDTSRVSNAGAFLSIKDVKSSELIEAVDKVIAAYGNPSPADEVLIQPMLTGVIRSGVGFSHDPNTCAPYRIVNWSDGGNTSTVTGGIGGKLWQQAAKSSVSTAPFFASIVALIEELLKLFSGNPLDCEFAVTREGDQEILWLLQVRPLILSAAVETENQQACRLKTIERKVSRGMRSHPFLMGKRTVYAVMPDWNPAEIIGIRPKPLALSLYRELVTDSIWAYQRHNYGYRNLRSFPLMPHFFGLPYIDVRLSFNSFIPADLNEEIAGRLVDHYIDYLLKEPTLHDKIEFEIVFSCYTLDLQQRMERLTSAGFSKRERDALSRSLRGLTNRIIHPCNGLWKSDAAKIDTLNNRREKLLASNADPLERIYWLIEDTKRYGTLPFAGLARAGFVAIQMLKSLVTVGVITNSDYDLFIQSLSTVTGQLTQDRIKMDKNSFLVKYGHLRPGTYDILAARYDENPDFYFDWERKPLISEPITPFSLSTSQMRELEKLLDSHGLEADPKGLFDFIRAGIELRELAKFQFSRNLSDALALITVVGKQYGVSREELAYCDISIFKEMHIAAVDVNSSLDASIKQGKTQYKDTLKVSLPPIITSPEDIWAIEWPETTPNFITQKQVTAPVVGYEARDKLAGAIVCIPNADPGFDWLFAYPIAGLITAWGGANSHMAIRAGELGLPAVIGSGEVLFRRWTAAEFLHLDCAGRRVEVLG